MLDFTAHFGRRRRFGKLLCVCKYFLFIWFWGFAAVVLLLEKWGGVVFVAVVLLREKWLECKMDFLVTPRLCNFLCPDNKNYLTAFLL